MGLLTVAKVAVENTAYSFDVLFEYSVPDFLCEEILPGKRVLVQFGNSSKKRVGIVFSVETSVISTKKLKSISSIVDDEPLLSKEMLKTAHFIHDRCFCTYFDACKLFLPVGLSLSVNILYAVNPDFSGVVSGEIEVEIYEFLKNKKGFTKSDRIVSACGIKKSSVLDKMATIKRFKNIIRLYIFKSLSYRLKNIFFKIFFFNNSPFCYEQSSPLAVPLYSFGLSLQARKSLAWSSLCSF